MFIKKEKIIVPKYGYIFQKNEKKRVVVGLITLLNFFPVNLIWIHYQQINKIECTHISLKNRLEKNRFDFL